MDAAYSAWILSSYGGLQSMRSNSRAVERLAGVYVKPVSFAAALVPMLVGLALDAYEELLRLDTTL